MGGVDRSHAGELLKRWGDETDQFRQLLTVLNQHFSAVDDRQRQAAAFLGYQRDTAETGRWAVDVLVVGTGRMACVV